MVNILIGDEKELRDRLCAVMIKYPKSMREYTRQLGFSKVGNGETLNNFLHEKRETQFLALLKIKKYIENIEKLEREEK